MTFSRKAVSCSNAFLHCCSWLPWNSARVKVLLMSRSTKEMQVPSLLAPLAVSQRLWMWISAPWRTSLATNRVLYKTALKQQANISNIIALRMWQRKFYSLRVKTLQKINKQINEETIQLETIILTYFPSSSGALLSGSTSWKLSTAWKREIHYI